MAANYSVHLLKTNCKIKGIYRPDYFPRQFHYKADAKKLVKTIEKMDGQAYIVNLRKRAKP